MSCVAVLAFTKVKAYSKPPPLVETVMAAVMTLMERGSDWATAKKALGEANFLTQVLFEMLCSMLLLFLPSDNVQRHERQR